MTRVRKRNFVFIFFLITASRDRDLLKDVIIRIPNPPPQRDFAGNVDFSNIINRYRAMRRIV